jgi:hypothetical protein
VSDQSQQINPERADVDGNLADGLGGVGVEQRALLTSEPLPVNTISSVRAPMSRAT